MNNSPTAKNRTAATAEKIWRNKALSQQRGAVAVVVALSMAVLVGFAGLALDMGRLYVHKNELQNAVDACALAASKQLNCDTSAAATGACPATFVQNAEIAGRFLASKNKNNFQSANVSIPASGNTDNGVTFSTALNGSFSSVAASYTNLTFPKFARCSATATGITPWFMGMLGIGDQKMKATAVATLAPSQGFCSGPPMGVCNKPGGTAPNFGYATGEWIKSSFNSSDCSGPVASRPPECTTDLSADCTGKPDNRPDTCFANNKLTGGFRWVDFTPPADGTNEVRDRLVGKDGKCDLAVNTSNVKESGVKQGSKLAYNTRFGIYPNSGAYTLEKEPPDFTGYAYPNKNPGGINQSASPYTGTGAYAHYRARQAEYAPFSNAQYAGGKVSGDIKTNLAAFGSQRRLVAIPVIQCDAGSTVPIVGMACVLMLNPMENGANGDIFLEFRGNAAGATSPCVSTGLAGDSTSTGPLVPTLVQ